MNEQTGIVEIVMILFMIVFAVFVLLFILCRGAYYMVVNSRIGSGNKHEET